MNTRMIHVVALLSLSVLLLAACLVPASPAPQGAADPVAANIQLARTVSLGIWGQGNVDLIDEYYADDYISSAMEPGEAFDKEVIKQQITEDLSIFSDHGVEVQEIFGEGDLVAVRYTMRGTPQEAVGALVDEVVAEGASIVRVEDGLIAREWEEFDNLGFLTQLGFIPPMADAAMSEPAADVTEPMDLSPEQVQANLETVRRVQEEVWGEGNTELIDELFSPDYVYNNAAFGASPDRAGLTQEVAMLHQTLSDVTTEGDPIVASGNQVAVRWSVRGTHTGEVMGIPASGNEIVYTGIAFYRFDEVGQITGEWGMADNLGLLTQMGAMQMGADEAAPAGAGVPTVTFVASEYAYDAPASIPGGVTRLAIENRGEALHDITVLKLGEGRTIDDVIGFFQQMAAGEEAPIPDWVTFYGGAVAAPGQTNSYLVDLAPGNYVVYSFGMDEEGVPDAAKGMMQTLTVTESESTAALPAETDITVEMVDFSYVVHGNGVQGSVQAGEQTLRMINTGMEPHEMILFRLAEGATLEDFVSFMGSEEPAGPPPFVPAGGAPPISDGVETVYTMTFEPGRYVMICFIPSGANSGMPHFMLGMVQELVVE